MHNNKRLLTAILLLFALQSSAESEVKVRGGAQVVSSYVWRGSYNAGASLQPALAASIKGFTLGAWGSVDFTGQGHKEVDLSVGYSIKGFTIGITDYWWEGEGAMNYFRYAPTATGHRFEANLAYTLPFEKFPLTVSWNTMFAGADLDAQGQRCYSTYIEVAYPFMVGKHINMSAFVGATPWYSPSILPSENQGFSVCNVGIEAQYAIRCSEHFSIPIGSKLIFNPATEDIHLVFGLSLFFGN